MFVYGSLLYSFVWQDLIGRVPVMKDAHICGFRRYAVRKAWYPGLWHEENGLVSGKFVQGLTADEIALIDEYEGGEYTKTDVEVVVEGRIRKSTLYLRPPKDDEEWDLEWSEALFLKRLPAMFRRD